MADMGGTPQFLPTVRASELEGTPVPLEYIDGHELFVKGELNYLAGAGAAGKTTLMLQLAAAVGLSEHSFTGPAFWLDRPVTTRGLVLFVSAEENTNSIHRKLLDVCADQCTTLKDLSNVRILDLTKRDDMALLKSNGRGKPVFPTPLFSSFEATVSYLKPALVIIDNRAQIAMADEIDRNTATEVGNRFRKLAAKHENTVILLVHPSVAGAKTGSSGSTGWNNTTRNTVLMCKPEVEGGETDTDDGKRQLKVIKSNYGSMGVRTNLQWRCGVYYCTDKPPRAGEDIGRDSKAERVFMKLLAIFIKRGRRVSNNPKSVYAPEEFFRAEGREGVSKREFEAAMNRLLDREELKVEVVSPGTWREKRWLKATREG